MRKYGVDNFVYGIIEDNISAEDLNDKEVFYVSLYDSYRNGYNATAGGANPSEFSEERRRKIGIASKGRKCSEQHKINMSKLHKGKVMTEDSRKKISDTMKSITLGTANNSFKPWWYEKDGVRVEVYDKTITQYEAENSINKGTLIIRFNKDKIGKLIQAGMFKGMRFGYIGVTQ
jgi:hypothetical protein